MKRAVLSAIFAGALLTQPVAGQSVEQTLGQRLTITNHGAFERGALQSLRAIEKLLQTRYEYGIGRTMGRMMGMRRMQQVANPTPALRDPQTFANMLRQFTADLDTARATLAQTSPADAQAFTLDVSSVWFDINRNGTREAEEGLQVLLIQAALSRAAQQDLDQPSEPVVIRFDGADHAWLTAYTHMLSGLAEAILAFDPSATFDDLTTARAALANAPTIPYTFDVDAITRRIEDRQQELDAIKAEKVRIQALRQPIQERMNTLQTQIRSAENDDVRAALSAQRAELQKQLRQPELNINVQFRQERALRREIDALKAKLPPEELTELEQQIRSAGTLRSLATQETMDSLYSFITALNQQPDATRLSRVRDHWRAMLAQNRLFWAEIAKETDDDHEWIGNPQQASAFGITVTAEMAEAWQEVLNDAEAVLEGRLLVPHPLLPPEYGINIAAYFDNPRPIDIAAWLHGRGAYDYAARGPKITQASWAAFSRLTRGRGTSFALFFN